MKIIVGCEFSQVVTMAFRARGHEAYSCDILPGEQNADWHFQEDIFYLLKRERFELGVFHPPCTHLSVSGARWFKNKVDEQKLAIEFFMKLVNADIPKIAIENPISIMSTRYRKPDQIIQPWQFGHGETKATCLWLKNVPKLIPTHIVSGRESRIHKMAPSANRAKLRSISYQGIADAFAEQWGVL